MHYFKKLKFTKRELSDMKEKLDNYIWVAIDARRGVISAGDEYVQDLRDSLLVRRSHLEDVFGFGLDLNTGEINYLPTCNRRNPTVGADGNVSAERRARIETLVHYFFNGLTPYSQNRDKYPRLVHKPADPRAS